MKKLSIIAGLVFTTVFFASCESQNVVPTEAANAPQPSRTLTTESETQAENQARKESLPKLKDITPTIDIEKVLFRLIINTNSFTNKEDFIPSFGQFVTFVFIKSPFR